MKTLVVSVALVILLFFATSTSSKAAIILNGETELQGISVSGSFEQFYGYSRSVPASSNTGFELVDTAVFMLLENSGNYALLATFGAFRYQGDEFGGSLSLSLTNEGFGSLLLLDDPKESISYNGNTTNIDFDYADNRTDGFIFGLGDGSVVDLLVEMTSIVGLSNFVFVDSNGQKLISEEFNLGNQFYTGGGSTDIPEPSLLMLFGFALLIGCRKRFSS